MKKKIVCILVCTLFIASIPLVSGMAIQKTLTPGVVDQQQPNTPEIDWLAGGVPSWQQFKHNGNMIEEIELHIGCWFSGSHPITLSIEENVGDPPLTDITYPAAAFPLDVQDWFTFDFPDVKLVQGKTYYMVLRFDPGSEYGWSGSHNDPYPDGASSHPDADWDYAFKTYVDKTNPLQISIFEKIPMLSMLYQKLANIFQIFQQNLN